MSHTKAVPIKKKLNHAIFCTILYSIFIDLRVRISRKNLYKIVRSMNFNFSLKPTYFLKYNGRFIGYFQILCNLELLRVYFSVK